MWNLTRSLVVAFAAVLTSTLLLAQPGAAEESGEGAWTTRESMPTARIGASSAVLDGKIYVHGGTGSEALAALEVYDPATDSWGTLQSSPSRRASGALVEVGGKLYAIGGEVDGLDFVSAVEVYDPASDSWSTLEPLPTVRYGLMAGVVGEKVFVCGGNTSDGQVSTVEIYDPATDQWSSGPSLPIAPAYGGAAVIDGTLYVVGRQQDSETIPMHLWSLDESGTAWTTLASLTTPRWNLPVAALDGELYALGGYTGVQHDTVEVYNPATDSWRTGTSMPTERSSLTAAVTGGVLFAIGGGDGGGPMARVEALLRGAFEVEFLSPLEGGVDNTIKPGQTVPIKIDVSCDGTFDDGVTAAIESVVRIDGSGTSVANEVVEDSGLSADGGSAMRLADGHYTYNLSTKGWTSTSGARFRVTIHVTKSGHVDTATAIVLKNR